MSIADSPIALLVGALMLVGLASVLITRWSELRRSRAPSQAFLRRVESTPEPAVVVGTDGTILVANPLFLVLIGCETPRGMQGTNLAEKVDASDRHHLGIDLERVRRESVVPANQYHMLRADGTPFLAECSLAFLEERRQQPPAVLVILRDVTARERAQERLNAKLGALQTFSEIDQAISSAMTLSDRMTILLKYARSQLHSDLATVFLLRPMTEELVAIAQLGAFQSDFWKQLGLKIGEGAAGWIAEHDQPLMISDVFADTRWKHFAAAPDEQIRSYLGVPLHVEGRVLGIIDVSSRTPRHFTSDEVEFLVTLANRAAVAIENAQLFEEVKRRGEEFALLYDMTRELAALQDVPLLMQAIVDRAAALLGAQNGHLYLFDKSRGDLELCYAHERGPMQIGTRLRMGEGMAGRVAQTRQSLTVNNYRTWEKRSPQFDGMPLTAVVQAPLVYRGELLGVLGVNEVENTSGPVRQFSEADERLLSLFAAQAASAIHSTELYEETRARAEQLALVYDAGLALNSVLEPRAQLEFLLRITMKALRGDRAHFFRYHADEGMISLEHTIGVPDSIRAALKRLDVHVQTSKSVEAWVVRNRLPLNLPDVSADARWLNIDSEVRSGIWVPISHENQVRGVLSVLAAQQDAFTAQDERLLVLFSNQVAAAMENVRLFEETRRRAEQLNALNEMSRALSSTLDLTEIYRMAYEHVGRLVECPNFALYLAVTGKEIMQAAFAVVDRETVDNDRLPLMPVAEPTSGQARAIATAQPVIVPDLFAHRGPAGLSGRDARSAMYVPMLVEGHVIGLLQVESSRPNAYKRVDADLMGPAANQIGLAIHNAQMYAQSQQRAQELALVNQVSASVTLPIALDEVLENTLRELARVLGIERGAISLLNEARSELTIISEHDPHGGPTALYMQMVIAGSPALESVVNRQKAVAIPNALDLEIMGRAAEVERHIGVQSVLFVPLIAAGQVVGAIHLGSRGAPRQFTDTEIILAQTIANQAATAIEKARLFEETRRRAERLAVLNRLASAINRASGLDSVLRVIYEEVTATIQADAFFIALYDDAARELEYRFRIDEGVILPPERRSLTTGLSAHVVQTRKPLLIKDWVNEQERLPHAILWGSGKPPQAWLGVPMLTGGVPVGVICVQSYQPNVYGDEEVRLLSTIADQVAVAIERARLAETERTRQAELTALYDLARALAGTADFDEILNAVTRGAVETLRVTFARVALLEGDEFILRSAYPLRIQDSDLGVGMREPAEKHPYCLQVLESNTPHLVHSNDPELKERECATLFLDMVENLCLLPLRTEERALGILMLGQRDTEGREPFPEDKIRLAHSIADQAASALRRAELFTELEKAYVQTVLSLANAVDAKDTYTADHAQRMAQIALTLGKELHMSARELEDLRYGTLLHDIGKIGIPDSVLQEPGPLSPAQWADMRRHPDIGAQIIGPIPRLEGAAQIVRCHHERFDGSGYPSGLAGEAIPLGARILAVVDAYSAITDKRVYKPSLTHEEAIAELGRFAGRQFDPVVVATFLRVMRTP